MSAAPAPVLDAVLACPRCRGSITDAGDGVACASCARAYSRARGYLDFAPDAGGAPSRLALGQIHLRDPGAVERWYESEGRPAFLRIMGANWGGRLSEDDERGYLREWLRPVAGPILDLACGTGHWTRAVIEAAPAHPVIGLDASVAMIDRFRAALPEVPIVRGYVPALPFADASLGAVVCWNALQILPEPGAVIREVGRCLAPGGTFVALTFRRADDATYRYFQRRHEQAFDVAALDARELHDWLTAAELEVVDFSGPGTFALLAARRR